MKAPELFMCAACRNLHGRLARGESCPVPASDDVIRPMLKEIIPLRDGLIPR